MKTRRKKTKEMENEDINYYYSEQMKCNEEVEDFFFVFRGFEVTITNLMV